VRFRSATEFPFNFAPSDFVKLRELFSVRVETLPPCRNCLLPWTFVFSIFFGVRVSVSISFLLPFFVFVIFFCNASPIAPIFLPSIDSQRVPLLSLFFVTFSAQIKSRQGENQGPSPFQSTSPPFMSGLSLHMGRYPLRRRRLSLAQHCLPCGPVPK